MEGRQRFTGKAQGNSLPVWMEPRAFANRRLRLLTSASLDAMLTPHKAHPVEHGRVRESISNYFHNDPIPPPRKQFVWHLCRTRSPLPNEQPAGGGGSKGRGDWGEWLSNSRPRLRAAPRHGGARAGPGKPVMIPPRGALFGRRAFIIIGGDGGISPRQYIKGNCHGKP